jgi:hypothetical protein
VVSLVADIDGSTTKYIGIDETPHGLGELQERRIGLIRLKSGLISLCSWRIC